MRTTPTTPRHLFHVWAHLSAQNAAEFAVLGLSLLESLAQAGDWMEEHGAVTAWLDGVPAFVLGMVNGVTWFAATQDYFDSGLRGLRESRRFVKDFVAEHGPLTTISFAPNQEAERWFKFLGFVKISEDPPMRVYRLDTSTSVH